jgi:heparin/heparan-sulfate lyase
VFLLPSRFVIFDRVTATDRAYRKDWLLHVAERPELRDNLVKADHEEGRMFCRTLLPENARLTAVGGPGREFLAAGKNWEIDKGNLGPDSLALMGQWRVEVTPGAARTEDLFLHVIQVGEQEVEQPDPVELVRSENHVGVRLKGPSGSCEVTFATRGDLEGHIRIEGESSSMDRPLAATVQPQVGILAQPR